MGMTIFLKLCLSVIGLAGIGSAIGVPLSLKSGGKISKFIPISAGGGKSQVEMEDCKNRENTGNNSINFGSQVKNGICGVTEGGEESNSSDYTSFFKDQWDRRDLDGDKTENQNQWTKQCFVEGLSSHGVILISPQTTGSYYLGLCGEDGSKSAKFVKKVRDRVEVGKEDSGTLGTCENDCFESDEGTIVGSTVTFEREKGSSGKKVTFHERIN